MNSSFVDDRHSERSRLEDYTDNPEHFDKLGDPSVDSGPGRCHVCLAWVLFPYYELVDPICPDCHRKSEAERELVRERVREALRQVWEGSE